MSVSTCMINLEIYYIILRLLNDLKSKSRDVYEKYVARARHGASEPSARNKMIYQKYVSNQHL